MLLLDKEYLVAGDILIMDSARIHGADATWDLVFGLLNTKGVQLIYLPKYSPEFNPVELFWRYLKTKIRNLPYLHGILKPLPNGNINFISIKKYLVNISSYIHQIFFNW